MEETTRQDSTRETQPTPVANTAVEALHDAAAVCEHLFVITERIDYEHLRLAIMQLVPAAKKIEAGG